MLVETSKPPNTVLELLERLNLRLGKYRAMTLRSAPADVNWQISIAWEEPRKRMPQEDSLILKQIKLSL